MALKKPHVVSILNQNLTVRTDADEHYVSEVAVFVGKKIEEVMRRTQGASALTAALMACLNIADEMLRYKEGRKVESMKVVERIRDLISLINLHLDGGGQAL